MGLTHSVWPWIVIGVVVLVMFGSKRLPDAARGLGRSMRILKSEMNEMKSESAPQQQAAPQPQVAPQQDAPIDVQTVDPQSTDKKTA